MGKRFLLPIVLLLLTGCVTHPAPAPAPPVAEPAPPRSCKMPYEPYTPAEPSPVKAQVYVKEDPGIAAPIDAWISGLPITVAVRFDQAVDRATFSLALADTRCDYEPGPIGQEVRWLSDREAEIRVTALSEGKPGPYTVRFGGGRDPAGKEVAEARFSLGLRPGLALTVFSMPLAGWEPSVVFKRDAHLEARSVSPDGRYLLLVRPIAANANTHSTVRIPYLADLKTGGLRSYSRGEVRQIRWDLAGRAVWINGWQRLSLESSEETGRSLLDRLPGENTPLLNAQVSPDGRWLAALYLPSKLGQTGKGDFHLVDLRTGEVRSRGQAFGVNLSGEGLPVPMLSWAPDSSSMLVDDYYDGVSHPVVLTPGSLEGKELKVQLPPGSVLQGSPTGNYLWAYNAGAMTRDGRMLPKDLAVTGIWTGDDRFLLTAGSNEVYQVTEVTSGKVVSGHLSPPVTRGNFYPVGVTADGKRVFVGLLTPP